MEESLAAVFDEQVDATVAQLRAVLSAQEALCEQIDAFAHSLDQCQQLAESMAAIGVTDKLRTMQQSVARVDARVRKIAERVDTLEKFSDPAFELPADLRLKLLSESIEETLAQRQRQLDSSIRSLASKVGAAASSSTTSSALAPGTGYVLHSRPPIDTLPIYCAQVAESADSESHTLPYVQAAQQDEPRCPGTMPVRRLRVLTYNVWFGEIMFSERAKALVELIVDGDFDVVCLQEVTRPFLRLLLQSPAVATQYDVSDSGEAETLGAYGVMILCRRATAPVRVLRRVTVPTGQGRSILIATCYLSPTEVMRFATCHFESLPGPDFKHKRRVQRDIAFGLLREGAADEDDLGLSGADYVLSVMSSLSGDAHVRTVTESAVLCGDFNYTAQREADGLPPEFVDAWTATHGEEEPGYTFDTETNAMAARGAPYVRMRIDRLLLRSARWRCTECAVLGTKPFAKMGNVEVHPSDHYAVAVVLEKS